MPPPKIPTVSLNDGTPMPVIGYGTYKIGVVPTSALQPAAPIAGEDAAEIVANAIAAGYKYLDCAQFYANEAQVGEGIRRSGVPRSELYIVGKVWCDKIYAGRAAVREQVLKTLQDLQTEYLDQCLVHWPVPGRFVEAYQELEDLRDEGKVRNVGVSNFSIEDYQELKAAGWRKPPTVCQIEINPFLYRKKTIDFYRAEGVVLQSYRALRDGKVWDDPVLQKMGAKHNATVAQVLTAWCLGKGFVTIVKSANPARMAENLASLDVKLDDEDYAVLDSLTTPAALETYRQAYIKCTTRDTPLAASDARAALTLD